MKQEEVIKSISYNQEEIIVNIMKLYGIQRIELDPTYSKGVFYKHIQKPKYIYDLYPQVPECKKADCRKLPFGSETLDSIMFDPPFTAGIPNSSKFSEKSNIIPNRFGSVKSSIAKELWTFYYDSLLEFYRLLRPKGILIFKCQDTVSAGKQFLSHVQIINMAYSIGFYPKDLFVLLAKYRVLSSKHKNQQHSRKYHAYFLVFIKEQSPVKYGIIKND